MVTFIVTKLSKLRRPSCVPTQLSQRSAFVVGSRINLGDVRRSAVANSFRSEVSVLRRAPHAMTVSDTADVDGGLNTSRTL